MTRRAARFAAAVVLAVPTIAAADEPRASSDGTVGLVHLRAHAQIAKAEAKAQARWRKMTRAERRDAKRRQRRATRRAYLRARASADEPSDVGSWAPPFVSSTNYKGFAVHAALLHTGKVLMWGQEGALLGTKTYAWLWDPAQGYGLDATRNVTPTYASGNPIPIFCSGLSFLADGRLLVVGGTLVRGTDDPNDAYTTFAGLNEAVIFDPDTETWTELPRPDGSEGRWYPTQVLLPDGRTLVASGYNEDPPGGVLTDSHEIYDAATNTFTLLNGPTQRRLTGLYPHLFTMPDGQVLMAGPGRSDSARFDPAHLDSPWTDLPQLAEKRIGGNAVLLPEGPDGSTEVATIGGRASWGDPPVASGEMIDLDDAAPSWSSFPSLNTPRWSANTILLPDRSMVTIGGDDTVDNAPAPEHAVELYDPVTGSWRVGPSQAEQRGYHSTALLLPDGRVLSTGDELNPRSIASPTGASPDETGEIYSPPYLFKGPRPVITSAPNAVRDDVPFFVEAEGDIDDAVLIAPAAVTHANDMSQRLVPLAKVAEHPGGVTLQSPPSANVAPPGWYMLFVLDNGVPSVARWVRLDPAAPAVPASPPAPPAPKPGSGSTRGPQPSPAPADDTGPGLELRFTERKLRRRLRHGRGLGVRVSVDEPATVDLSLLRGDRRVGHAAVEMDAGLRRLHVRPRRRARTWLRHSPDPKLRLYVIAVDALGNDTAWTRVIG